MVRPRSHVSRAARGQTPRPAQPPTRRLPPAPSGAFSCSTSVLLVALLRAFAEALEVRSGSGWSTVGGVAPRGCRLLGHGSPSFRLLQALHPHALPGPRAVHCV